MTLAECPTDARTRPETAPDRFTPCPACGRPVRHSEGKPRLRLCGRPACESWRKFLAAARKAAAALDFPETADGRAARKQAIREVMMLRNDFPVHRHSVRDEEGRFADGVRPRRVLGRCRKCQRFVNVELGCQECPKGGK